MRIRFLITSPGSIGGADEPFLAGHGYDVNDAYAETFLREGVAVKAEADPAAEVPATGPEEAPHDADV